MEVISYKEFTLKYRDDCKETNVKFNMKELGKRWSEYKKRMEDEIDVNEISKSKNQDSSDIPKDGKIQSGDQEIQSEASSDIEESGEAIDIVESESDVLQKKIEEKSEIPLQEQEVEKPVPAVIGNSDNSMYEALANSIHETTSNLLKLLTDGRIVIKKDHITRLNSCGVEILKKADKSGELADKSPVIAYVLTVAGIGTEIFMEYRLNSREAELNGEIQKTGN